MFCNFQQHDLLCTVVHSSGRCPGKGNVKKLIIFVKTELALMLYRHFQCTESTCPNLWLWKPLHTKNSAFAIRIPSTEVSIPEWVCPAVTLLSLQYNWDLVLMGSEARPGFKQGNGYRGQDLEQYGYHKLYQHPPFASMVFSEIPTSLSGL